MSHVHDFFIGKYIQWKNGLRLKVVKIDPEYSECFIVENPSGKQWQSVAKNVLEARIITKEEFSAEYSVVKHDVPQVAFCSCCNWRVGMKNVQINLDLKQGQIPTDEADRIEKELKTFFQLHGIAIRSDRTDGGVKLEFISFDLKMATEENV